MDTFIKKTGEKIRELRKSQNETQEDLAKVLHKSAKTIGHYETGTRKPSKGDLEIICEHYGVNLEYFQDTNNFDTTKLREAFSKAAKKPDAARAFWIAAFPIVQNQSEPNDHNFMEGFKLHQATIFEVAANMTSILRVDGLIRALNYYQKAADKGIDEAKINIASMLICLYSTSANEQLNVVKEIIKEYEIDELKKECLNYVIEKAQETSNREKAENIDPTVMELLLGVSNDRFRDIREFYLASRYYWGLPQEHEEELNLLIGLEMMYLLDAVGNEFASNFITAFRGMMEIVKHN